MNSKTTPPVGILEEVALKMATNRAAVRRMLLDARRANNLSIEKVAERMGVEPATVEELEAYWSNPTLRDLNAYALAVGLSMEITVEAF